MTHKGSALGFVPFILVDKTWFFGLFKSRKKMFVILIDVCVRDDNTQSWRIEKRYVLTDYYDFSTSYAETKEVADSILETVFLNNGMELLIQEALNK